MTRAGVLVGGGLRGCTDLNQEGPEDGQSWENEDPQKTEPPGLRLFMKGWQVRLAGGFEGREVTTGPWVSSSEGVKNRNHLSSSISLSDSFPRVGLERAIPKP